MTCGSCEVENLVLALHEVEVVKFGNFKLNNDLACDIWVGKVKVERSQKKVARREEFDFHFYYAFWFFSCVASKQHAFSKKDAKLCNSEKEKETR